MCSSDLPSAAISTSSAAAVVPPGEVTFLRSCAALVCASRNISSPDPSTVARASRSVALAIRAAFEPEGLSVYQANGKAAGQTVFHYHVHLLPRHAGDGMELTWPVKNPPRETLEGYAQRIRVKL